LTVFTVKSEIILLVPLSPLPAGRQANPPISPSPHPTRVSGVPYKG